MFVVRFDLVAFLCSGCNSCTDIGVAYELLFFFKQKTAYELRFSDWSSDVCSSDLLYFKADLWGMLAAGYTPSPSPTRRPWPPTTRPKSATACRPGRCQIGRA